MPGGGRARRRPGRLLSWRSVGAGGYGRAVRPNRLGIAAWLVQPLYVAVELLVAAAASAAYSLRDDTISSLGQLACASGALERDHRRVLPAPPRAERRLRALRAAPRDRGRPAAPRAGSGLEPDGRHGAVGGLRAVLCCSRVRPRRPAPGAARARGAAGLRAAASGRARHRRCAAADARRSAVVGRRQRLRGGGPDPARPRSPSGSPWRRRSGWGASNAWRSGRHTCGWGRAGAGLLVRSRRLSAPS